MKFVIFFVVTLFCVYHHVSCNQQTQDDPNRPFWATRGRRSGGRSSIKADDDILEKWQDEERDGINLPENLERDRDALFRKREQATSFLASLLNALSAWDGEVIRKRGDGKSSDPSNPFWAARG